MSDDCACESLDGYGIKACAEHARHLSDALCMKIGDTRWHTRDCLAQACGNCILRVRAAPPPDMVDHPPHYQAGGLECIDVIEHLELGYRLGTALKYLWRHKKKGKPLEDLKKMRWFLNREIAALEKEAK